MAYAHRSMLVFRRVLLIAVIAYWALLFYMTHTRIVVPLPPQANDKIAHFVAYAVLATLLYCTIWVLRPAWRWIPLAVFAVACIYGVIDEWTQPLVGRSCDRRDWLADAAGALSAVFVLCLIQWRVSRRVRVGQRVVSQPSP